MGIYIGMNIFFDNNFDVYKKEKMKLECHHLIKMSI